MPRKIITEMLERTTFFIVIAVNIALIRTSNAAPYDPELEMKPSWNDNPPTPVISQPCPVNEHCWEWLTALPIARDDNAYVLQEKSPNNARFQNERQIHRDVDSRTEQSKKAAALLESVARSHSPIIRQISPRPMKKDVFMSRSWGPGGLPFSVLYMNPHSTRGNDPNTGMAEVVAPKATSEPTAGRSFEGPLPTTPPSKHPNYRVALRNGASGQPRRQYSIIPQLFISYGWGPLGKSARVQCNISSSCT